MREVPRHLFVPDALRDQAYNDEPLPIGDGQTISQPYIVALMTSLLDLDGSERVLEIGTGSGYQAAVLSRLAGRVFSIEIREGLGLRARDSLQEMGFDNVDVRIGNGYLGWPEEAPFDAIIVTAAPETLPATLVAQLKLGGRMVVPVGSYIQDLVLITKTVEGLSRERVVPVRFVPMIGEGADQ
jgi:protein-L-isoaspartate(D-aspartate) O-methyltransferase